MWNLTPPNFISLANYEQKGKKKKYIRPFEKFIKFHPNNDNNLIVHCSPFVRASYLVTTFTVHNLMITRRPSNMCTVVHFHSYTQYIFVRWHEWTWTIGHGHLLWGWVGMGHGYSASAMWRAHICTYDIHIFFVDKQNDVDETFFHWFFFFRWAVVTFMETHLHAW